MDDAGYGTDVDALKDYMIEKLFDTLGIAKYIDANECTREAYPFANATNSWTIECPKPIDVAVLPEFIACHIPSYCTGVDCCVYVDLVKRSFKIYVHLDPCNYIFAIGIDQFGLNISLLEYDWGKTEEFSMFGVMRISYSVTNLDAEHQYVLNLKISICFKSAACDENIILLEDTRIPKIGCEWNTSLSDFNLDQYLERIGSQIENIGDNLSEVAADKLLETLGVSMFMFQTQCKTSGGNTLRNECDQFETELTAIPDIMTCSIPVHCTAIECCISIPLIGRSISVSVDLDPCGYQLKVRLERFTKHIQLFDYTWGTWQTLDIKGVFVLQYRLDDLKSSKQLVVSVRVLACFDRNKCSLDIPIVDNLLLPKPLCNYNGTFKLPGFSFEKWITENANKATDDLTDILKSKLFEDLGITPYLLDDECSKIDPSHDGWVTDCPLNLSLPVLPNNTNCHLVKHCTGFSCCLNVPLLQRSFSFHLDLDSCNFALNVGIEKLQNNQSLINYEFGRKETIDLFGIVQLSYTLVDEKDLSVYKLSVEVGICLDANMKCDPIIPLLEQVPMPKPLCNLNMGFRLPDFNIAAWLEQHGLTESSLKGTILAKLFDSLGLSQYMLEDGCRFSENPYKNSVDGWNIDCPLDLTLPRLPHELRCYVPSYCTGVECCLNIDVLKRGFSVVLSMDACSNRLVVSIDNLKLNVSLVDYEWGSAKSMSLMGVIKITYSIRNYEESRQFGIDMSLTVCLSHDNCEFQMTLLDNKTLTKPLCRWDTGFMITGFSLDNWLQENNILDVANLMPNVVDKLMKETGLKQYLQTEQCNRTGTPYSHSVNRWRSDCEDEIQLQDLPQTMSCYISDICTSIRCCIDVSLIKRSFEILLKLDRCLYLLEVEIENLKLNVPLVNYDFGEETQVFLLGVVRLTFTIEKMNETAFRIDARIDVCFEEAEPCLLSVTLLKHATIPNIFCTHGTGFQIPGFSFDVWVKENGISTYSSIDGSLLDTLLSVYGIDKYLKTEQCNIEDVKTNAMQAKCNVNPDISIMSDMTCASTETCLGISCCIQSDILKRSFEISFEIDVCRYVIEFSIETYTSSVLLDSSELDIWKTFELQGLLKISYRLIDMFEMRFFTIDVIVKLCLSDDDQCVLDMPIFQRQMIPKPLCQNELGFNIPDFSLSKWLTDEGSSSAISVLPIDMVNNLIDDLGISKFLLRDRCTVTSPAWKSGK
ncbi:uncharacterized protein LOC128556642 [Mercenaria mercenaria]|uniref:uncharacterized protein LOC128556642 n=1 Tax=Mercenaria mercenaria TaxID=6596 RepID=UPI00234EA1FD|nr:uncharacterized protein LOC128556642 [Mercenaria mercenaria]